MDDASPFIWRDDEMITLSTFSGNSRSGAVATNDWGWAVGYSYTASGADHAVLWRAS
jgi:uncharacterized membrane protein